MLLCCCWPCTFPVTMITRKECREKYGLEGSTMSDFWLHLVRRVSFRKDSERLCRVDTGLDTAKFS